MAEIVPGSQLSTEVIDVAWAAAQSANVAFDAMKSSGLSHYSGEVINIVVNGMHRQYVPEDIVLKGLREVVRTTVDFSFLCEMAGHVMLMENTPFSHVESL